MPTLESPFDRPDELKQVRDFWEAFDPLRGKIPVDLFRYLVTGLLFLRFLSLDEQDPDRAASNEGDTGHLVVADMARWPFVLGGIESGDAVKRVNRAFDAIREANASLAGTWLPDYSERFEEDHLAEVLNRIDEIRLASEEGKALLYLAPVYPYWLLRFADRVELDDRSPGLSEKWLHERIVEFIDSPFPPQVDINSLGPLNYSHPSKKPFFLTPNTIYLQRSVVVSFDGTNYLIVWAENHYTDGDWLLGCRVAPNGTLLDPGGFLIHRGESHIQPQLALGKDPNSGKPVYLVIWLDWSGAYRRVKGALIRPVGSVEIVVNRRTPTNNDLLTNANAVKSDASPIFPDIRGHYYPFVDYPEQQAYHGADVTFNGTDFVVSCWSKNNVLARLVDPATSGVRVETPVIKDGVYPWGKPITLKLWDKGKYGLTHTRLAAGGGSQAMVTWHQLYGTNNTMGIGLADLWGVKLDFSGATPKVGKAGILTRHLEAGYGYCELDANGSGDYMLAWHDIAESATKKVKPGDFPWPDLARGTVKRVAGDNLALNFSGRIEMMRAFHDSYYPRVAFDGKNYLITFGGTTADVKNFHPKLQCLVGIVLGGYVTPDGKLIEAFFIKAEDGGSASLASSCFGKNEGLLVYEHSDPDQWSTTSYRKLRLRFIARSV